MKKSRRANLKSLGKRFKPRLESLEPRVLLTSHGLAENGVEEAAAHYADNGHDHTNDWERIHYSVSGKSYYLDPADRAEGSDCTCGGAGCPACANESPTSMIVATAVDGEKVGLNEIPIYHSNPGAPNVFYLDFNGQIVKNTDWNQNDRNGNGNDGQSIHAVPYDTDRDLTTFSEAELDAIYEIWQRVAEDFIPFDIDITTEEPDPDAFKDGRGAARVIISTNVDDVSLGGKGKVWFKDVGGISFTSSYWWAGDIPAWVFHNEIPQTPKAIAEVASHEFGHMLGLGHAGKGSAEYHPGIGEGETSWAPIMGAGYSSNVTQWTDGNYSGGIPKSFDNFEIMTGDIFQVSFREDDHGQSSDAATPLVDTKGHLIGSGIIETNADSDIFSLEHPGGPLDILVSPAALGPNLDVLLKLYDADSDIPIAEIAPEGTLSAELKTDLPAGTYFLEIDGGGHSPETGEGYSQYGSVGSYHIDGILGVPKLTAIVGGDYAMDEGTALSLDARLSYGPVGPLQFAWDIDRDGEFDDATGATPVLAWDELQSLEVPINDQGNFEIGLRVSDSTGSVVEETTTLTVHNVAPVVALNVPNVLYTAAPIRINASATDVDADPLTFEWNFGDGSELVLGSDAFADHVFDEPGTYAVEVTARDDDGAATTTSIELVVIVDVSLVIASSISNGDVVGDFSGVSFDFNHDLSSNLNASSISIVDTLANSEVNLDVEVIWDAENNRAEFPTVGLLHPGLYRIVLGGFANEAGVEFDGNGDGVPGGTWTADFTVTLAGDADYDLDVDFADFLVLANNFGAQVADWDSGDFDNDGLVTFDDFLLLADNFGSTEATIRGQHVTLRNSRIF